MQNHNKHFFFFRKSVKTDAFIRQVPLFKTSASEAKQAEASSSSLPLAPKWSCYLFPIKDRVWFPSVKFFQALAIILPLSCTVPSQAADCGGKQEHSHPSHEA